MGSYEEEKWELKGKEIKQQKKKRSRSRSE
jgi:hypothetical protein